MPNDFLPVNCHFLRMSLPSGLIDAELKIFENRFREAVRSPTPLLDRIMRYIVKRKGKQLRPMFVLLSAKLCGEIREPAYRAASLVELLHTATLVHDDVVDDSHERRGFSRLAPQSRTTTVLPGLSSVALTPCQPSGKSGVVQWNSHRASLGPRFTHPWLRTRPKLWCQNAPCSA